MNALYEQNTGLEMVQRNNPIVKRQVIHLEQTSGEKTSYNIWVKVLLKKITVKKNKKDNCRVLESPKVEEPIS